MAKGARCAICKGLTSEKPNSRFLVQIEKILISLGDIKIFSISTG